MRSSCGPRRLLPVEPLRGEDEIPRLLGGALVELFLFGSGVDGEEVARLGPVDGRHLVPALGQHPGRGEAEQDAHVVLG